MDELKAVTASELVTAATQAALIARLVKIGVISTADSREIYETALLMIEKSQGRSPASQDVFAAARELIEQHLRPKTTK